jgi:hypothetical protein
MKLATDEIPISNQTSKIPNQKSLSSVFKYKIIFAILPKNFTIEK